MAQTVHNGVVVLYLQDAVMSVARAKTAEDDGSAVVRSQGNRSNSGAGAFKARVTRINPVLAIVTARVVLDENVIGESGEDAGAPTVGNMVVAHSDIVGNADVHAGARCTNDLEAFDDPAATARPSAATSCTTTTPRAST